MECFLSFVWQVVGLMASSGGRKDKDTFAGIDDDDDDDDEEQEEEWDEEEEGAGAAGRGKGRKKGAAGKPSRGASAKGKGKAKEDERVEGWSSTDWENSDEEEEEDDMFRQFRIVPRDKDQDRQRSHKGTVKAVTGGGAGERRQKEQDEEQQEEEVGLQLYRALSMTVSLEASEPLCPPLTPF